MFPQAQVPDGCKYDEGTQANIKGLDKVIGPEKGRDPVGFHAHDQIECNEGENKGECPNVEHGKQAHPVPAPLLISVVSGPPPQQLGTDSAFGGNAVFSAPQGVIEVDKSDPVENEKGDKIPRE